MKFLPKNTTVTHTQVFSGVPRLEHYIELTKNNINDILEDLEVPEGAILVSVDVDSLYPSIPQSECLDIIYEELHQHRHLLLFDPNLVIRLLQINVNNNYFQFATFLFQQITGTAMGAAFSPTIANIFMSVTLKRFLRTQKHRPLLLKRYIDDIIIIWTGSQQQLEQFLKSLNSFHPALHYSYTHSTESIDYLDLTIYKGPHFLNTQHLDTRTFQKSQNLYQYLHFESCHQKSIHKAIILGECMRYVRTNTSEDNYISTVHKFKTRLHDRNYPPEFVDKTITLISYKDRNIYLTRTTPEKNRSRPPPLFKCIPPAQFHQLKQIVLEHYLLIQKYVPNPRFIPLRHKTLSQTLVRAQVHPTDDQLLDLAIAFGNPDTNQVTAAPLPQLKPKGRVVKKCGNSRCATCQHLQCQSSFTSTKTKVTYPIRHYVSCKSKNVIYLITCTKCKKQYVGMTTKQLNVRINHHRTSIFNKKGTFIHKHFNLHDHTVQNLKVQVIDHVPNDTDAYTNLQKLEKYWIKTLKTFQPIGLNVSIR